MDWSKAKSILIIAFIVTNLILGYVLVENKSMEETFNKEFIEDVREKLLENNITIIPKIPVDTPSLPKLTVEYEVYDSYEVAKVFGVVGGETGIQSNSTTFEFEDKTLTISNNNKKLLYTSKNSEELYENLNKRKLEEIVKNFLSERNFPIDDYKDGDYNYDSIRKVHYLEYIKTYNNRFVEETYMKFEIDNTGVVKFERYWLETKGVTNSNFSISSAPNVLLRLISDLDFIGKTITAIDLSYNFSPDSEYVDPKNAMKGQAIPAWRIKFSDGTKKFLD